MIIASIRQTAHERVIVTLEDGSEVVSTPGAVSELMLYSGKTITEEDLIRLKALTIRSLALEKAIDVLSRRRMSAKELRRKLTEKGMDTETAEYCVSRLQSLGYIDDEAYAAAVVRHYAGKGYGQSRIRAELAHRGVDRDYWETALEEMPENTDKIDHFIETHLTDPDDRDQVRKVSAALYRRGYSWDEIRAAIRRYSSEFEEI